MLALLIKVVREMVFTLGKWSFAKKPGESTSYYSQGSNQRLNSQHTCRWGAARGPFAEPAARLRPGLDPELPQPCLCRPRGGPEKAGSLLGRGVKHWAETVEMLWHLLKKTLCGMWQPLQIRNNVNDSSELSVQLHWVIWNLWFMN